MPKPADLLSLGTNSEDHRTPPYYDRDFIEREFTPQQVAAQGKHLLFRALNIGRAVGFIGSGVAAAYGRPTWWDLIDEPGRAIMEAASTEKASVVDAVKVLKKAWIEGVSDPDLLPLQGQLYRTLSDTKPGDEDSIQKRVKERVRDDDYVSRTAWNNILDGLEEQIVEPLSNDERVWRSFDTWGVLLEIIDGLAPAFTAFEAISQALHKRAGSTNDRLSAEERCLLPLLFAGAKLLEREDFILGVLQRRQQAVLDTIAKEKEADAKVYTSSDGGRSAQFDPARTILDQLRIRRLLTTNYDFELERALERMGFEPHRLRPGQSDEPSDQRVRERVAARPRGDRARSMVLKRDTAADLVGFGSQAHDFDFEIFHLHGRAFDGADERLVITERDYQAVYMRDAPEAHVMEEAMTATMGGNPIIFLGMGMLESDVLRPLRRFVSGPGGQTNRSIVALLPTEESLPRRLRASLLLYVRYGVHVIFYGDPEADSAEQDGTVRKHEPFQEAPWLSTYADDTEDSAPLYRSISRVSRLKNALDQRRPLELAALHDYLRRETDESAVTGTLHRHRVERVLEPIACSQFAPDEADSGYMNQIRVAVTDLLMNPDLWKDSPRADAARRHLWRLLSELDGRIRTRALCYSLNRLVIERQTWWRKWREEPHPRRFAHAVGIYSEADGTWGPETNLQTRLLGREATFRSVRFGMSHRPGPEVPLAPLDDELDAALKTLLAAPDENEGRRIFVAHGERGAGRGSLFHALADRFARPMDRSAKKRPYAWGLFTNAAFSTEYSSVVDGVVDFLGLLATGLDTRRAAERAGESDAPHPGRRAALSRQLAVVCEEMLTPKFAGRRGLLVIGGIEVLFRRRDGSPKNTEVVDTLSAFLEDAASTYPIDIVFICGSQERQIIFGDGGRDSSTDPILCRLGTRYVEPDPATPDIRPPPQAFGPMFPATIVPLKRRSLRKLIFDMLTAANLESVERLAGTEWDSRYRFHQPDWRRVMRGRFECAIVMACAIETLKNGYRHAGATEPEPKNFQPDEAARARVATFLVDLGDQATRAEGRRSTDTALTAVLRQYQVLGDRKNGICPALCERILKHLAVMSTPLEVSVLIRCPEIDEWLIASGRTSETDKVTTIHDHLEWLLEHRLVFAIRSRREFLRDKVHRLRFERYSVHQSLQSYFYRQIGSPHLELGDSRLFTVSLFASQRSDLPTPTQSAYDFMTRLIRRLICYPVNGVKPVRPRYEWMRQDDVCALRAALGLARSAFSLAVVSRFSEFGDPRGTEDRSFGYMEEFRLLLRWMIYQAGLLGIEKTDPSETGLPVVTNAEATDVLKKLSVDQPANWKLDTLQQDIYRRERINALYKDEITWLYNECGLVSLAQGNLDDAAALLKRAAEANKRVEFGSKAGPNGLRIRLNQAVLTLERGYLSRATQDLRDIQLRAEQEPVVLAIARGYEGLVEHLKGRREAARRKYKEAIERLRKIGGEGRAISIFSRHLGDLVRPMDLKEARQYHKDALAEAETARQHDQVHRVYISMAHDELNETPLSGQTTRKVLRRLDEVIQYADRMELYNLKVEALTARAKAIELQGETQGAGQAAVLALSLASLYGQRLRAVGAMNTLACIIADRPAYQTQAWRILGSARTMAETADYQLVLEKAERRLIELGALPEG